MANLFDAAAERLALETGIPVSQASMRVRGIDLAPKGPLLDEPSARAAWYCICGGRIGAKATGVCDGCGK